MASKKVVVAIVFITIIAISAYVMFSYYGLKEDGVYIYYPVEEKIVSKIFKPWKQPIGAYALILIISSNDPIYEKATTSIKELVEKISGIDNIYLGVVQCKNLVECEDKIAQATFNHYMFLIRGFTGKILRPPLIVLSYNEGPSLRIIKVIKAKDGIPDSNELYALIIENLGKKS